MATISDVELTDEEEVSLRPIEPEGLYEVIGEEIREKPLMSSYEYELATLIALRLHAAIEPARLGRVVVEMLFDLRPAVDKSRRPDVAFVSAAKWPVNRRAPRKAAWTLVPDLAVEILSPSNSFEDIFGKMEEYFLAGSRRVLLVLPDYRKVYDYTSPTSVRILAEPDAIDGGEILPGFHLPLLDLFGDAADD